jgi:hypothetical protein
MASTSSMGYLYFQEEGDLQRIVEEEENDMQKKGNRERVRNAGNTRGET